MKNKGFTLVEILAIISIMGVVMILVVPTMLSVLRQGKQALSKYDLEGVEDAGKMYLTDIDDSIDDKFYELTEDRVINGHSYKKGDKIKGYDFKTYVIEVGGIDVTMETLVKEGYYDKNCVYAGDVLDGKVLEKDHDCNMPKDCTLHVGIDYKMSNDGRYYVTNGYTSKIKSGCE